MRSSPARIDERDLQRPEHEPIHGGLVNDLECGRDLRETPAGRHLPPEMERRRAVSTSRFSGSPKCLRTAAQEPVEPCHRPNVPPIRRAVGAHWRYASALMTIAESRVLRSIFLVLGFFFLGVAFVGVAVPLIPTVGPVLLAAFFFSKSSERFDHWLVNNRLFGGIVRDWRAGLGFTIRAKTIAIVAIIVTFTISVAFVVEPTPIRVGLIALASILVVYISQLPTKRTVSETA